MEELRDIEGFDNYQVSNLGRIYNKKKHKWLKIKKIVNSGYYQIRLSKDGKYYYLYLHRLVASTFIPNPSNLRTVNHINGNKLDNKVSNLEWADDCRQQHHACLLGLKPTTKHILTEEEIINVYKMYYNGSSVKDIATYYNTRIQQVCKLIKGQRHKNLFRQYRDKFNL